MRKTGKGVQPICVLRQGGDEDGAAAVSDDAAVGRSLQPAVGDDADRLAHGREGTHVQLRIVRQHRADAGNDGAAFGAQYLYVLTRSFAGNPFAEAV